MNPHRRTARRIAATVLAFSSAITAAGLLAGSPAEAKRAANTPKTWKFANLETNYAKHTASFTANGITANDDWDVPVTALCNNENVEVKLNAKSTLTINRTGQRSKSTSARGSITGPVILGYSFGVTQTGSFQLRASAPYTCTADGTCNFSGKLTNKGKPAGTWSGSFALPTSTVQGYFKVTFEDILISS